MRDKVLCELLSIDAPSPEIMLEEDDDLCLDWGILYVSITSAGKVNWAFWDGTRSEHGTDLERVKQIIAEEITHESMKRDERQRQP